MGRPVVRITDADLGDQCRAMEHRLRSLLASAGPSIRRSTTAMRTAGHPGTS